MRLAVSTLVLLALGSAALADPVLSPEGGSPQELTPEAAEELRSQCAIDPEGPGCVEARERCLQQYDAMPSENQEACRILRWDPETYASTQIQGAASQCSLGDSACVGIYDACRSGEISCEELKRIACGAGTARCDDQYICTPSAVEAVCRFARPRFGFSYATLQYTLIDDPRAAGDTEHLLSAQSYARGIWRSPVGFAYSSDLELGGGLGGGFVYEYNLGLGFGFRAGRRFGIGVTGGGGLGGIYAGRVPFGLHVPVEGFAMLDFDIGQLILFARPRWVFTSDTRQEGSEILGELLGLDEFSAGLGLTILGSRESQSRYQFGYTGWTISLKYEEKLGTRFYGIGIGIGQSQVSD